MELKLVKQENSVIRKELLETLDKFSMQAEKLKRYEMSAAAVVESMRPTYVGSREEESAESLRTVMQSSAALASATASLCDEVLKLLENSSLDPVLSAKLRLRIDSLKKEIEMLQQEHEDTIAEIEQDAAVYVEENKKIANMTQTEDTIRLQTERDTYKTMYEQLLNRLVNGGAA